MSEGGHPYEAVADLPNVAVLMEAPYVVLDFDIAEEAEVMLRIVKSENLPCGIMRTRRGYHFWFTTSQPLKNVPKTRLTIGLHPDIKSWGEKNGKPKLSYCRIKHKGEWFEWIQPPHMAGELPFWLTPNKGTELFKMADGDGRNQKLFEYILRLKRYTKEQVAEIFRIINTYVFAEPLEDSELESILRNEAFPATDTGAFFDESGDFKHHIFATALQNTMNVVTLNDLSYVYREGYYQLAERDMDKKMVEVMPSIKKSQRTEVEDYVKIISSIRSTDIPIHEDIINCANGRLNIRTHTLLPFDPAALEFTHLPVTYEPSAYSPIVDTTLDKVFCHDADARALFEEMTGYLLLKSNRYRKGFLMFGKGKNGKSTILNMLKSFIGHDNCSTLDLSELAGTFMTAELEHKLANIGDDIDADDISSTGKIKKLFTGESQTVQHKFGKPFTLRSYAKLLFSCNEIPRIRDKSEGMYSRLVFVPFMATFNDTDPDFDPDIERKMCSPEALSYLLNLGLSGLSRLLSRNRFTIPTASSNALESYRIQQSTVLSWIAEEEPTIAGATSSELYDEFRQWCEYAHIKNPTSLRSFHKEIEDLGYERERKRVGGLRDFVFNKM